MVEFALCAVAFLVVLLFLIGLVTQIQYRVTSRHLEVERKFDVDESTVTPSFEGIAAVARVEKTPQYQGIASRYVPRIEGSHSNVVGLPISLVWKELEKLRISAYPVASTPEEV